MADVRDKNFYKLIEILKEKPRSINEIATALEINWRTAESYLTLLRTLDLVKEEADSNSRIFFYKDKNNYFGLPVKPKDEKIIKSIYALIKKFSNKEPTKTQVYKIIWKVNKQFNLGLPIGWYRFGPCCEIIYQGDEESQYDFPKNQISFIKETTEKYVEMDNFALQRMIYTEDDNKLYLTKENLLSTQDTKPNEILMDLIKYSPKESIEATTDFVRAVLLVGWDRETKECFNDLWKYITMINYKDTLTFYHENISVYMDNKIIKAKKDAQSTILNTVKTYMDSKHSQDSRYQSWKKKGNQKHS